MIDKIRNISVTWKDVWEDLTSWFKKPKVITLETGELPKVEKPNITKESAAIFKEVLNRRDPRNINKKDTWIIVLEREEEGVFTPNQLRVLSDIFTQIKNNI